MLKMRTDTVISDTSLCAWVHQCLFFMPSHSWTKASLLIGVSGQNGDTQLFNDAFSSWFDNLNLCLISKLDFSYIVLLKHSMWQRETLILYMHIQHLPRKLLCIALSGFLALDLLLEKIALCFTQTYLTTIIIFQCSYHCSTVLC